MTTNHDSGIPAEANYPASGDENLQALWRQPAPVDPRIVYPKKKARWGLVEVFNSIVILICLQLAMALVILFDVLRQMVPSGVEKVDEIAILEKLNESLLSPQSIIISSALMYFAWIFMMWYSTRFRGHKSWAKDFWLQIKLKDIPLGLGLGLGMVIVVQGVSMGLSALGVDMSTADNTKVFQNNGFLWELFFMIGLAGMIGPVMEELFFRGFLMQGLIRHYRRGNVQGPRSMFGVAVQKNSAGLFNAYIATRNWGYRHKYVLSALISSAIFGLMHFQGTNTLGSWLIVVITGSLGLVFATVAIKTRRLGINIFGHIFYNTTIAILALTM